MDYKYQLNKNFSIGCMLFKNARIGKIYDMIEDEIIGNLLPIKPDRSFPRKRKNSTKFPASKKDCFRVFFAYFIGIGAIPSCPQ